MSFTRELWASMAPIYAAILRHPFLAGLTDGSLPRESFVFYAVQDALYLREFARGRQSHAAGADEPRLHELSAGRGLRRAVSRGGRRSAAVLLDLLGGRQG